VGALCVGIGQLTHKPTPLYKRVGAHLRRRAAARLRSGGKPKDIRRRRKSNDFPCESHPLQVAFSFVAGIVDS